MAEAATENSQMSILSGNIVSSSNAIMRPTPPPSYAMDSRVRSFVPMNNGYTLEQSIECMSYSNDVLQHGQAPLNYGDAMTSHAPDQRATLASRIDTSGSLSGDVVKELECIAQQMDQIVSCIDSEILKPAPDASLLTHKRTELTRVHQMMIDFIDTHDLLDYVGPNAYARMNENVTSAIHKVIMITSKSSRFTRSVVSKLSDSSILSKRSNAEADLQKLRQVVSGCGDTLDSENRMLLLQQQEERAKQDEEFQRQSLRRRHAMEQERLFRDQEMKRSELNRQIAEKEAEISELKRLEELEAKSAPLEAQMPILTPQVSLSTYQSTVSLSVPSQPYFCDPSVTHISASSSSFQTPNLSCAAPDSHVHVSADHGVTYVNLGPKVHQPSSLHELLKRPLAPYGSSHSKVYSSALPAGMPDQLASVSQPTIGLEASQKGATVLRVRDSAPIVTQRPEFRSVTPDFEDATFTQVLTQSGPVPHPSVHPERDSRLLEPRLTQSTPSMPVNTESATLLHPNSVNNLSQSVVHSGATPNAQQTLFAQPQGSAPQQPSAADLLAQTLCQALSISRMPIVEPEVFNGDPLKYRDWRFSLSTLVEGKNIPVTDRIHFLKKYLTGPPREAVEGFFNLRTEDAYQKALNLLESRYGCEYATADAFRQRIDQFPKIHSNKDRVNLQKFSDLLTQCLSAQSELSSLNILDDVREIASIASKLPDSLATGWGRRSVQIKRSTSSHAKFSDFCEFVQDESSLLNDPVLVLNSNIKSSFETRNPSKPPVPLKPKITLNTQSGSAHSSSQEPRRNNEIRRPREPRGGFGVQRPPRAPFCPFHRYEGHALSECRTFGNLRMEERRSFVKDHGLCFDCLSSGHRRNDSSCRPSVCRVCEGKHPTSFHYATPPPFYQEQHSGGFGDPMRRNWAMGRMHRDNTSHFPPGPPPSSFANYTAPPCPPLASQSDRDFPARPPSQWHNDGAPRDQRPNPLPVHNLSAPSGSRPSDATPTQAPPSQGDGRPRNQVSTLSLKTNVKEECVFTSTIVPVFVSSKEAPEKELLTYALIDSMSGSSFVEDDIADKLSATSQDAVLSLSTMSSTDVRVRCKKVSDLRIRGYYSQEYLDLPPVYTKHEIPVDRTAIPSQDTVKNWAHLSELKDSFAPKLDVRAGLLIGYDVPHALRPIQCVSGQDHEPFALQTPLGWSLIGLSKPRVNELDSISASHCIVTLGRDPSDGSEKLTVVHKTMTKDVTTQQAIQVMERDFTDLTHEEKTISQDDKMFLQILEHQIRQKDDGYYEMPLPFRNNVPPDLPNNKAAAYRRAMSLKGKLSQSEQYYSHYQNFMNEITQRGDAERVPLSELDKPAWYIPHHGVYHPKKPDKLRVVFDCSARYQNESLNDHLLQGPDLINPLVGVLCRFRKGEIAFTCDIEKMFHQFRVVPEHQDFLRFLWWDNGDITRNLSEYRMKVHLFGATSSPGCANFGLKTIAKDYAQINPEASSFLCEDFYVDDGLKASNSAPEAIQILNSARQICAKGNLRLHKVVSNSKEVMESIPESERGVSVITEIDQSERDQNLERTLGLYWCINTDCFKFKVDPQDKPVTKRGLLSTVASVYDPLGLISPVVLQGRKLLQDVCRMSIEWDAPIEGPIKNKWACWKQDLHKLETLSIPRNCAPKGFELDGNVQLHHFSDASMDGYGQCSYLRITNTQGQVHTQLIMSKARVSPLKAVTIPRLELQAAVVSVKVSLLLNAELKIERLENHYWTDSRVVLGYLANTQARYHTFVANRIEQIRLHSELSQWHFVCSQDNPADHASRGRSVDEMTHSNWFHGPEFLRQREIPYPEIKHTLEPGDKEVKNVLCCSTDSTVLKPFENKFCHFSSLLSLVRAFTALKKRAQKQKCVTPKTVLEMRADTLSHLTKLSQSEAFGKGGQVDISHPDLKEFDPFLDDKGVMRMGGRLKNVEVTEELKHPILLSGKSHLSYLITMQAHRKTGHSGRTFTINETRRMGYWVTGVRRIATSLIHACVVCKRLRGTIVHQKMSDLPEERFLNEPPFTSVGMDIFGPFNVTEGRKTHKRWGLLITCLASRAIHIELLYDMTTDSFLNALRSFIAIRGEVRHINCDSGSNLKGAKEELERSLRSLNQSEIIENMARYNCEFRFNVPTGSHHGGVFERCIRTVRSILSGLILNCAGRLDTPSLRTLFLESAAIANSRPLTVSDVNRADSPTPLSPNDLLTQKGSMIRGFSGKFVPQDIYLKKRWRKVQYLTEMFWERFQKEYLTSLQPRRKWRKHVHPFAVGDIVLLREPHTTRTSWPLGVIECIHTSRDTRQRKATLRLGQRSLDDNGRVTVKPSRLDRPFCRLVLFQRGKGQSNEADETTRKRPLSEQPSA